MTSIILSEMNSSDFFCQVILTAVLVQGAGPQDGRDVEGCGGRVFLSSVAPGKTVRRIGYLDCSMHKALGCEVAFTDRYGHSWVRKIDGHLCRIRFKTPVDYYGLMLPVEWMDFDEWQSTRSGFERKDPETIDNDSSLMMQAALLLAVPLLLYPARS